MISISHNLVFVCLLFIWITVTKEESCIDISKINLDTFKKVLPPLGEIKGSLGRIAVFGGSDIIAPGAYYAGIAAIKSGADLVYVFTSQNVSSIVQTYSSDILVLPYLHKRYFREILLLLPKMNAVVLGPGTSKMENDFFIDIVTACHRLNKPLIVDAGAILNLADNIFILQDYPAPGVILTPDDLELKHLTNATRGNFSLIGNYVSVLAKGKFDRFYYNGLKWTLQEEGSGKRTPCQGDMLAGFLGTFFYWALKANTCEESVVNKQSLAAYAAASLLRKSSKKAFEMYGRSMTVSDIVPQIHLAFKELFS